MSQQKAIRVDVKDFHPYSGQRYGTLTQSVVEMFGKPPGGGDQWLLLFEWPADATTFVWSVTVTHQGTALPVADTEEEAVPWFEAFNIPKHNRAELFKKPGIRFRAVLAPTDATARIQVAVNTSRPQVKELVRLYTEQKEVLRKFGAEDTRYKQAQEKTNAVRRQLLPLVNLSRFSPHPENRPVFQGPTPVPVVFMPDPDSLTPMIGYSGFVAFDLGNTGSMLAYMDENHLHPDAIELLNFTGKASDVQEAVPTAVRVQEFTPPPPPPPAPKGQTAPPPAPKMPDAVWKFGRQALAGPGGADGTAPGALVLGAKRLLSDPDRTSKGHPVWMGNARRLLPRDLPAELFITSMVEQFHAGRTPPRQIHGPKESPPPKLTYGLAVTCPTTFTDREISNLRKAVYTGWRRALGEGEYRYPPEAMEQAIPLVLDEASAAAMFFVYRDLINGPGADRGLHYLHPNGVNLLVYDCGGGTTDIALVHVFPVYAGADGPADQRDRVTQLHVDVIGRTGHRGFGGDNITEAVFVVLKARLAGVISPDVKKKLDACKDPTALATYLTSKSGKADVDRAFPTTFNRQSMEEETVRQKAAVVLALWQECEQMKRYLGTQAEINPAPSYDPDRQAILGYVGKLKPGVDPFKVVVKRAEVDALVAKDISITITRANGLIRRRMGADERPAGSAAEQRARGGEVHRVYVTGNASQYPTILERLTNELDVAFLKEQKVTLPARAGEPAREVVIPGRLVFDVDNLKGAVAKGAVAALYMKYNYEGVKVRYDNQLTRRLPFDIRYRDRSKGDYRVYREGQLYEALANEPKFLAPPARDPDQSEDANQTIRFSRQWPDEPTPHPYLTFRFSHELVGPLKVEYIPATDTSPPFFQMTDEGGSGGGPVRGEEEAEAKYVSPPQSGAL